MLQWALFWLVLDLPEQSLPEDVMRFETFAFGLLQLLAGNTLGVDFDVVGDEALVVGLLAVFGLHQFAEIYLLSGLIYLTIEFTSFPTSTHYPLL